MGIKLRNIPYNIFAKSIGVALLIITLMIIIDYQYLSNFNNEYFYKDNFYETDEFQQNYVRLSHNVVEKHLDLVDEETIDLNRVGKDKTISFTRLDSIEDNLRRAPSFIYVLINTETGEQITNINRVDYQTLGFETVEDYIGGFETVIQWDSSGLYFPVGSVMEDQPLVYRHYNTSSEYSTTNVTASDVVYRLRSGEWIYYTAIDLSLMEEDILFGNPYYDFMAYKSKIDSEFPVLVISVFTLFFMVIYLSMVIGKTGDRKEVKLFFYDYIPLEIQGMVAVLAFLPILDYQGYITQSAEVDNLRTQLAVASVAFLGIAAAIFLSVIRLVKAKYIYKNPITFKIGYWIKDVFTLDFVNPLNKVKIFGMLIAYLFISLVMLLAIAMTNTFIIKFIAIIGFMGIQLALGIYLLVLIRDLSSLIVATRHRASGDADYPIVESDYKIAFANFAKDLNALQNGLQLALDEAIRGEKMKTELITNVSHDLKNPLTSIITYIDLVEKSLILHNREGATKEEKQELQENMKGYIRILNNKGYRLKTLIEDLVSASKASSGNLEVVPMNINIRQLLVQIFADREEYFDQQNLEVVMTPKDSNPIWSLVDPNHMYRVFENLISNMLKYSLKGTRVFIDTLEDDEYVVITFKNISNHPLDNSNKNLAGRFVRGDDSRTTEGSGLGLSIVESLLILQNGIQHITVDGDMFKVELKLPKGQPYKEPVEIVEAELEEISEVANEHRENILLDSVDNGKKVIATNKEGFKHGTI